LALRMGSREGRISIRDPQTGMERGIRNGSGEGGGEEKKEMFFAETQKHREEEDRPTTSKLGGKGEGSPLKNISSSTSRGGFQLRGGGTPGSLRLISAENWSFERRNFPGGPSPFSPGGKRGAPLLTERIFPPQIRKRIVH